MSKQNKNVYTTCSDLAIFMYRTRNSMDNLSSYCGLVDAKIRASDKDLPVHNPRTSEEMDGTLPRIASFENT